MANPTIVKSGALDELILITDDQGIQYNAPKVSVSFVDSSNSHVYRIDFIYGMKEVSLTFTDEAAKITFLTNMRLLY